jgi:hypothetical protein
VSKGERGVGFRNRQGSRVSAVAVPGVSDGPAIEGLHIGVATSAIPKETTVTTKKTPAPRRAGTASDISADEALRLIGDDPETLLLAIRLMDRMLARRKKPRR